MFQRGRQNVRDAYDNHFMRGSGNNREVTFHRVVNIVERRNPMMGGDFDRRGPMFDEHRTYQDPRECQNDNMYPQNQRPYMENQHHRFGNFRRNSPPPRNQNDGHMHNRDDLRHHLDSRNNGRGGNMYQNRNQDSHARSDFDYRRRETFTSKDRSPVRQGSLSNTPNTASNTKHSDIESSVPKAKPFVPASPPRESSDQDPPEALSTMKDSPPAFTVTPKEEEVEEEVEKEEAVLEEIVALEQDLKSRRSEAIKSKALEIEKDYRQDCETFRTVVKMLVEKEPSLDYLLQAPLEKSLEEIKDRCLDALKQFITELDEAIEQSGKTDQTESKA